MITSITEADGIIRIPRQAEGIKDSDPVHAELLKPLPAIRNTIVIVGSHDNTLDVLADQLRAGDGALTLSSSHVGSMGGLMAVKRGVCHLAGAHLLDTQTGDYNLFLCQTLPARHAGPAGEPGNAQAGPHHPQRQPERHRRESKTWAATTSFS